MKKTIIVSQAKTSTGQSGYKATAKDTPGEDYTGRTIPDAVGGLIRIIFEDLGVTEDMLQRGVPFGHNWDDMENYEIYYLIVRDQGCLSIEGP